MYITLVLYLISLKFHALALFYFPLLLPLIWKKLTWKQIIKWCLVPVFTLGILAYFFYFQDHTDSRHLQEKAMEYDRLFLPLFSPEAPWENYNLFSWNHIFDFLQVAILWGPALLILLFALTSSSQGKEALKTPPFVGISSSLILVCSLLFAINPLLSLPIDWDLFCLPVPLVLVLTLAVAIHLQHKLSSHTFIGTVLGCALLTLPSISVHQNRLLLAKKYESTGIRIYHTYYEWTNKILTYSLDETGLDEESKFSRRQQLISKLEPYARQGIDFEYSDLIALCAKHLIRNKREFQQALPYLDQAFVYDPKNKRAFLYAMEAHFSLGNMKDAYRNSAELVRLEYPSHKKALRAAIHCALGANHPDKALKHCNVFLKSYEDPFIQKVKSALERNVPSTELFKLFSGG